jgi:hypothetical protein
MRTFKSFIQIDEITGIAPKAKKEHEFVHSTYLAQVKDPGDLEKVGPEEVGPKDTKSGQGKRPADRLDNKQKFGEEAVKEMKTYKKMMKSVKEADFNKQQTKMAHTIGKEFEKKGVGDEDKGGPYAVATAMVRDKPEAAKNAYDTIKAKMKEEASVDILFKLYEDLNEDNREFFMLKLEEDAEALLDFAISQVEAE